MQKYVAGFLFNQKGNYVALVEKLKPEWQKGKLNGIGGKVEPGESFMDAMVREFKEETGVYLPPERWNLKVVLSDGKTYEVAFFYALGDEIWECKTVESERIVKHQVSSLYSLPVIPNLRWMIPMCLDKLLGDRYYYINVPTGE